LITKIINRMMKILPLIYSPDPLLKQVSKPVEKIDDNLKEFMQQMLNTMYQERGVGLAAVQVGKLIRAITIDVDYDIDEDHLGHSCGGGCGEVKVYNTNPRYFINPEIIDCSKEKSSFNEGCLSFPTARSMVDRPKEVTIKYLNLKGEEKVEKMGGILATCIQHEIDHLNGITFVDHISKLKRDLILKKMQKMHKFLDS